jgi:chromosome segregation ATPase
MVFDAISFLLGGLIFGVLVWGLQSYLTRPQKTLHGQELREVKQQLSGAKQETERIKGQLSEKTLIATQLETAQAELKQRLPKLEGFERANADLRLQMQGFDNVKAKLLAAENELLSLKQKAAEFDALQTKLEAVQTEFSSLKAKTAGFESIQSKATQADELEAKLVSLELEKTTMHKEVNAAVLKASDAEAAQAKLKASLTESVAEVARVRAGMQQFEGLKARIDQLEAKGISNETQAKLDSLETELGAYKARVTQLETAANTELTLARGRIRELEHMPQSEALVTAEEIEIVEPVQLENAVQPEVEIAIESAQLENAVQPEVEIAIESAQFENVVQPEVLAVTEPVIAVEELAQVTQLENAAQLEVLAVTEEITEPVQLENAVQEVEAPIIELVQSTELEPSPAELTPSQS